MKENVASHQQNPSPATITTMSLHRRWVAADFLGWFTKHFLVILGKSFPFYPNTKRQFGRKQSIKIGGSRSIFNIYEIQVCLERAVNKMIALAIPH